MDKHLQDVLKNLPKGSGVYLMKNKEGRVIYIGKAKNLKKRVSSYFTKKQATVWTHKMVEQVVDIEVMVTATELEALLLENNLIKEKKPRYNILLKDDKNYLFIKVSRSEDFPQVSTCRRMQRGGDRYFGPYTSASEVRSTLKFLRRVFPYANCGGVFAEKVPGEVTVVKKTRALPCLDYHIKRCGAPCIGAVTKREYGAMIDDLIRFLEGKNTDLLASLKDKMAAAADRKEYEKAAVYRDRIETLAKLEEKQRVVSDKFVDQDIVGLHADLGKVCANVLLVRRGKLIRRETFILENKAEEEKGLVVASFLKQYYGDTEDFPSEILLPVSPDDELLGEFLAQVSGKTVKLVVPQRGDKRALVKLAEENAAAAWEEQKVAWLTDQEKTVLAAAELASSLCIKRELKRIEGYDISHTDGHNPYGSMVVFTAGRPDNKEYRSFQIKEGTAGRSDDYAAMAEVLRRRLTKIDKAKRPDLILIDGGKGQLNAVLQVMREIPASRGIAVCALAKREEELYRPGRKKPICLPKSSSALFLVQRIRDEAHRFALGKHTGARDKQVVKSRLDAISGVGAATKKKLLRRFGSIAGIRAASDLELLEIVSPRVLQNIREGV